MLVLRDYQKEAVEAGIKNLTKGKNNGIIVAPTGSGKSLIISGICHQLNSDVLILQPTKEILEQNYQKLRDLGITDIGIYSDSMSRKDIGKYTYATIKSIYKKPELFTQFRYIILDECHLLNPKGFGMYKKFFESLNNPKVLGLTATPYRLVQSFYMENGIKYYTSTLQVLNRIYPFFFREFIYKIDINDLINKGYLSKVEYIYPLKGLDVSKIVLNSEKSDFDKDLVEMYVNSPTNVSNLVDAIIQNDDKLENNLIFCSSIRHANNAKELLGRFGYDCTILTGEMPVKERDKIISDFRSGNIKRLINVGVLTTGFDMPNLYGVTLARPTLSLALYYQILGRLLRIDPNNPNKVGKFIDITNASKRMGRIETIKLTKDGFKDQVETEVGVVTGKPLFTFRFIK